MSKELCFQKVLRNSSAIDNNKGVILPLALSMNGVSHEFFAGAALTAYQHRYIGKGNALDKTEDVLHGLRVSDNPMKLISGSLVTLL